MALWVKWKKPVKSAITLDPEDVEDTKDIEGNTDDNYTVEPVQWTSCNGGHFFVAPAESRSNSHKSPYIADTFIVGNCYSGHNFLAPREKVKSNNS